MMVRQLIDSEYFQFYVFRKEEFDFIYCYEEQNNILGWIGGIFIKKNSLDHIFFFNGGEYCPIYADKNLNPANICILSNNLTPIARLNAYFSSCYNLLFLVYGQKDGESIYPISEEEQRCFNDLTFSQIEDFLQLCIPIGKVYYRFPEMFKKMQYWQMTRCDFE
ncbi:MAG: hypothetical protein U0T82_04175 [Bacteroidales bacterium]